MNKRIRELAEQCETKEIGYYFFDREMFAELIVKETIRELVGQMWHYGIDESNNPSFYKAIDAAKEHFGVEG